MLYFQVAPEASNIPKQYSCIIASDHQQNALKAAETLGVSLADTVSKSGGKALLKAAKKQTELEIRAAHAAKQAKLGTTKS